MNTPTTTPDASPSVHEQLHGHYLDDLFVGLDAVYAKTVTEADIVLFAGVSGDSNPIHLNAEFAAATPFETPIAHGMLSAAFISTVLGTKLPGPGCVYMNQTLFFRAPVRVGDTVVARAEVLSIDSEKDRVVLATDCRVGETVVLEGEATMMVAPRR